MIRVTAYLYNFLEDISVLFPVVVVPQEGEEVAGEHPVEAMKQTIDPHLQVENMDICRITYTKTQ